MRVSFQPIDELGRCEGCGHLVAEEELTPLPIGDPRGVTERLVLCADCLD